VSASVRRSRQLAAPPDAVWSVLARFGDLARWAPGVDHACLLHDGELAPGIVRRVQVGRMVLLETVDEVELARRLGYRIDGLPPVLRRVRNDWELRPAGGGTEVAVTTTVDAGPRPPQQLVARLVARRLAAASDSMLEGLADHLGLGTTHGGTPVA
jgi:carbon monoxide dehydrogenase subunit G